MVRLVIIFDVVQWNITFLILFDHGFKLENKNVLLDNIWYVCINSSLNHKTKQIVRCGVFSSIQLFIINDSPVEYCTSLVARWFMVLTANNCEVFAAMSSKENLIWYERWALILSVVFLNINSRKRINALSCFETWNTYNHNLFL